MFLFFLRIIQRKEYGGTSLICKHYHKHSPAAMTLFIMFLNPFVPNATFLHHRKTSKTVRFSVFRGMRKSALGTNGFIEL